MMHIMIHDEYHHVCAFVRGVIGAIVGDLASERKICCTIVVMWNNYTVFESAQ